ncbi:MAG: ribosome biogenesis protein [Candidatus Thermoplasmatota archaeon]|nr:ribosome biogenesis protein [Candidatus Thermoplasmatota archaeon]
MRSLIFKCPKCGAYTMSEKCPADGNVTRTTIPMRYSPGDKYADYRRALIEKVSREAVEKEE